MATITIPKKLNKEVKSFIVQAIYEVLNDPDFGLALNEKAKKRLRQALIPKQKTISFSEIKKRYY
jgi:tripartite-type tricarboxylate transporter receptor subunit TctC